MATASAAATRGSVAHGPVGPASPAGPICVGGTGPMGGPPWQITYSGLLGHVEIRGGWPKIRA
jgi:hypothetical protein